MFKCNNLDCEMRKKCFRFTSERDKCVQAFIDYKPEYNETGWVECEGFIDIERQTIIPDNKQNTK